ncbi:MAG: hypothetical protein WKF78_02760 [Candidatus Limnocylindrales bacterium]
MKPDERGFEDAITGSLVEAGGYRACKWGTKPESDGRLRPRQRGLDTAELFAFIDETQPEAWERLVAVHGGPSGAPASSSRDRLAKQLDERGTVDVLRHGVSDHGIEVRLAYLQAGPRSDARADRALHSPTGSTVTRQLPYDAGRHEDARPRASSSTASRSRPPS